MMSIIMGLMMLSNSYAASVIRGLWSLVAGSFLLWWWLQVQPQGWLGVGQIGVSVVWMLIGMTFVFLPERQKPVAAGSPQPLKALSWKWWATLVVGGVLVVSFDRETLVIMGIALATAIAIVDWASSLKYALAPRGREAG